MGKTTCIHAFGALAALRSHPPAAKALCLGFASNPCHPELTPVLHLNRAAFQLPESVDLEAALDVSTLARRAYLEAVDRSAALKSHYGEGLLLKGRHALPACSAAQEGSGVQPASELTQLVHGGIGTPPACRLLHPGQTASPRRCLAQARWTHHEMVAAVAVESPATPQNL